MLSKKTINVVLICVVISLWGTVLYKYVNRFFIEDTTLISQDNPNFNLTFNVIEKDTFKLSKLKRDPFLNKMYTNTERVTYKKTALKNTLPKPIVITEQSKFVAFPNIEYFGYIKSKNKSEELVLLKVNNRLERVKINSNIDGLVIKKIYKDSIEIYFNKEKRTFIKN